MTRRTWIVNGSLVVVLVAAGAGAYLAFADTGTAAPSTARTAAATTRDVAQVVTAAGAVQSAYQADLDFTTSGVVTTIGVKPGDAVTKGQTLATLDTTQLQLQVDIAQDNLDQARDTLANAKSPTAGQRSAVNQATLALAQAQDNLAGATLTAPADGTVTAVTGQVGKKTGSGSSGNSGNTANTASAGGGAFITITDLKNLVVKANVAENDVSRLKADQQATVTVNALPDRSVQAKVTQVDLLPTTAQNVVQYGVALSLADPPEGLRPGQSAGVEITVAEAKNALAIPVAALTGTTVRVLDNGRETAKNVEVGVRGDQYVQITSGLTENEQVVLPQVTAPTQQNTNRTGQNFPGAGGNRGAGR